MYLLKPMRPTEKKSLETPGLSLKNCREERTRLKKGRWNARVSDRNSSIPVDLEVQKQRKAEDEVWTC
jgi:hypothetical protein